MWFVIFAIIDNWLIFSGSGEWITLWKRESCVYKINPDDTAWAQKTKLEFSCHQSTRRLICHTNRFPLIMAISQRLRWYTTSLHVRSVSLTHTKDKLIRKYVESNTNRASTNNMKLDSPKSTHSYTMFPNYAASLNYQAPKFYDLSNETVMGLLAQFKAGSTTQSVIQNICDSWNKCIGYAVHPTAGFFLHCRGSLPLRPARNWKFFVKNQFKDKLRFRPRRFISFEWNLGRTNNQIYSMEGTMQWAVRTNRSILIPHSYHFNHVCVWVKWLFWNWFIEMWSERLVNPWRGKFSILLTTENSSSVTKENGDISFRWGRSIFVLWFRLPISEMSHCDV